MFTSYMTSKDHYTVDWEYYEWGEETNYEYYSEEWEVMSCHISKKTMTCTLSVQDFSNMKVEWGFSTQELFQACVDLAQELGLSKIVYIHDRYNPASLQIAELLSKSAVKVSKEFYNEAEFFWYETIHYIYTL